MTLGLKFPFDKYNFFISKELHSDIYVFSIAINVFLSDCG